MAGSEQVVNRRAEEKVSFSKRSNKRIICVLVAVLVVVAIAIATAVLIWHLTKPQPGEFLRAFPSHGIIHFAQGQPKTYEKYTNQLTNLYQDYENDKQLFEEAIDCEVGASVEQYPSSWCRFDLANLGYGCSWERDFGFDEGRPCIVLQLKPPSDWKPSSLKEIKVTCEGGDTSSKDNLGEVHVSPLSGFSVNFFPLKEEAIAPLVAVQFTRPMNGMLLSVKCKLVDPAAANDERFESSFSILVD